MILASDTFIGNYVKHFTFFLHTIVALQHVLVLSLYKAYIKKGCVKTVIIYRSSPHVYFEFYSYNYVCVQYEERSWFWLKTVISDWIWIIGLRRILRFTICILQIISISHDFYEIQFNNNHHFFFFFLGWLGLVAEGNCLKLPT